MWRVTVVQAIGNENKVERTVRKIEALRILETPGKGRELVATQARIEIRDRHVREPEVQEERTLGLSRSYRKDRCGLVEDPVAKQTLEGRFHEGVAHGVPGLAGLTGRPAKYGLRDPV